MAIFGLARSGLSALKYMAAREGLRKDRQEACDIYAVNKGAPETWESFDVVSSLIPGRNCLDEAQALELFGEMDLIVKSPGIPFGHPSLALAREKKVEIVSEIEFAFRRSKVPVVAVTGTNGKTTTATMTAEMLKRLGKRVFLGGNIGHPYSEILRDPAAYDWAVIEVSSFQLENIKSFRPRVAVLTNISPSHGERYDSFEVYKSAKLKLFQNMGEDGLAVLPAPLADLNLPCSKKSVAKLDGFDFSRSKLAGEHNKENLFCAYVCALEIVQDKTAVDRAARDLIDEYAGVPYRIQYTRSARGMEIYNDGKSTNMASTLAAVDSFPDKDVFLVLGGKLRDARMDFSPLKRRKNIREVFAFGEARDFVEEKLGKAFRVKRRADLAAVFEELRKSDRKGILLFSPAFPSFDLYRNYEERAKDFNRLAMSL